MGISYRCENAACRKALRVKDEAAGKKVKCPGCGQSMLVPAPGVDSRPVPVAPKSPLPAKTKSGTGSPGKPQPQRKRWPWVTGATIVLLLGSAATVYFYN